MQNKPYKTHKDMPTTVGEPVTMYEKAGATLSSSNEWNPNVPFVGTQEEWWEHFHKIEEGSFMTLEEFNCKFKAWKTEYLASRLK